MRHPLFIAVSPLIALSILVPLALADPGGVSCEALFSSLDAPESPESALAQAWLETSLQDPAFDSESVRSWLEALRNSPDAENLAALAFTPPANVLGTAVLEAYGELSRMVEAVKLSNRFSSVKFESELKQAIARHLGETDAANGVRRASAEERTPFRTTHSHIDLGDSIRIAPLVIPPSPALPAGRMVSITGYGTVVFNDLDGGNLVRASVPGSNFGSLTLLETGNILVVSQTTGGNVFTPAGTWVSRVELPESDQKVVPVPLDGGGFFLAASMDGDRTTDAFAVVLSGDGKSARNSRFPRNEFSNQPLKLRNGSIAVTGERGDLFLFDPQGNLANLVPVKHWISHAPAQLTDGTIVLVTDEGSVRFFDEAGIPKSSWIFFKKKVALGQKPSSGPVPLPDGTVAVQTYRGLLTILDSNGTLLAQGQFGESFGTAPRVLSDGSLLLEIGNPSGPGDRNEFVRVVRNGDQLQSTVLWKTSEMLTSPLVRLKDDLFAAGTISGKLILFDERLVPHSRLKMDGALQMPPMLMPDGRIAVGGESGKIHLLDFEAALEGIPIDFGQ